MRIAYFDCFAGISGDMILGALVDAGLDLEQLKADLATLPFGGYDLKKEKIQKLGIGGTKIQVITEHEHEHEHRHLSDICQIIKTCALPDAVKNESIGIFTRLAEAEGKVHQCSPEQVHFHEVGAVDAIIDIVGSVSGLWRLGIDKVYASALHTGCGWTKSAHGLIPVPAPATMELLHQIPVYSKGIEKELVTPTGAAIISMYCRDFGSMPSMTVEQTGYGAGDYDLEIPNLLRVNIGKLWEEKNSYHTISHGMPDIHQGNALMMDVNIDDMNPEFYDYLINKLLQAGAMDVFMQSIQMKKNRPATRLSIMIKANQAEKFYRLVFAETTSIGVRVYPVTKFMQPYEIVSVKSELGSANVKIVRNNEKVINIAPEYEDCRVIAEQQCIPIKEVYDLVKYSAIKLFDTRDEKKEY